MRILCTERIRNSILNASDRIDKFITVNILTITHIEKHVLNLKFTPWTLSPGDLMIHMY